MRKFRPLLTVTRTSSPLASKPFWTRSDSCASTTTRSILPNRLTTAVSSWRTEKVEAWNRIKSTTTAPARISRTFVCLAIGHSPLSGNRLHFLCVCGRTVLHVVELVDGSVSRGVDHNAVVLEERPHAFGIDLFHDDGGIAQVFSVQCLELSDFRLGIGYDGGLVAFGVLDHLDGFGFC